MDALKDALKQVSPKTVKEQLTIYAPQDAQQILAEAGVRDEHVFPVPAVLEAKPTLIGYYRLLLGIPQKSFYKASTGMSQFKSMEERGLLKPTKRPDLEGFCQAMAESLAQLVRQMEGQFTSKDLTELPLLTLGSKFQGANNNVIGKQAMMNVFISVAELVKAYILTEDAARSSLRTHPGVRSSSRFPVTPISVSKKNLKPANSGTRLLLKSRAVQTQAMPITALAKQRNHTRKLKAKASGTSGRSFPKPV